MPYTRRDLIRDAALISATGLVAGTPTILGCHSKPPKPPFSGVRVFFCGSWIFCSDGVSGMYAIARDMFDSNGCSTHIFPFGRWQSTTVPFDHGMPHLVQNPAKSDGTSIPYALSINPPVAHPVSTAMGSPSPVEYIFQQSQMEVRFAYLNNNYDAKGKCPIKINTSVSTYSGKASGIRVIALPIPKRIRARGLVTRATFSDNTGINLLNQPSVDHTSSKMDGIATTHIFDYDGASSLTFKTDSVTDNVYATEACIDYHFHTVPPKGMGDHANPMFQNLLEILTCNGSSVAGKLCVNNPCPITIQPGPDLPDGGAAELDYDPAAAPCPSSEAPLLGDLASCSGPGFGIGGNVIN